jgi:preprotein translocase subunit SecE
VARDRQRAKQRRQRRAPADSAERSSTGPAPSRLHRDNVPGELDHASGQVEQFEAALVAGGGGEAVAEDADVDLDSEESVAGAEEDEADEASAASSTAAAARLSRPTPAAGGSRVLAFLRASWAELQRVQWPDRRQVAQATAVVLGFVLVAGAYLGLADSVAQRIVDFIL